MASKKKRERRKGDAAKLEMTPMIDVVFQLLIFFIVTLKQEDILSHLDISRPAPDPTATKEEQLDLLKIQVYNGGYIMRKRPISFRELDRQLSRFARYSKNMSVIIECTKDSQHSYLVQLLDLCAKAGLTNLSVFSL